MEARGRRHGLFWALVLVAVAATVGLGGGGARARAATPAAGGRCAFGFPCPTTTTTLPSDTTTTTAPGDTTTTTTPGPPSPYTAAFVPCRAVGASGPCDQTPQQIQLAYPQGTAPAAVQVDWVPESEPAGPSSTSVTFAWSDGTSCGSNLQCWPWPSGLTDGSFILNGTYDVAACGAFDPASGGCQPQSTFTPDSIGLAVRPDPPASVTATSAGPEVTIRWTPPGKNPPDLVGYTVHRDGRAIYTCSTDTPVFVSSNPCPQSLAVADHPGDGNFAYAVSAIRLGVDTASADTVSSAQTAASGAPVTVPGPVSGTGGGGNQNDPGSIPVATTSGNGSGTTVSTGTTTTTLAGGTGRSNDPAGSGVQPIGPTYPSADPPARSALTLKVPNSPSHTDVVPVAVLALGILALAVAAHFLYLKVEFGVVASRFVAPRRRPE